MGVFLHNFIIMHCLSIALLMVIYSPYSTLGQESTSKNDKMSQQLIQGFNLTSAECFDPTLVAAVNLFKEWAAFNSDGSDGYCYDNQGTGYQQGQTYISCMGCMKYTCMSRPCEDRDGSLAKMFWVLDSLATQCCQNCEGKIFPPNTVVEDKSMNDECNTVEHSVCKTSSVESVGTIEVSYMAGSCCLDQESWLPAGTTVLEKASCSARTCIEGRSAQWERTTKYQGGCGCCEYNSSLVIPGECQTMTDGSEACCCDGQMVRTIDTDEEIILFEPTG